MKTFLQLHVRKDEEAMVEERSESLLNKFAVYYEFCILTLKVITPMSTEP